MIHTPLLTDYIGLQVLIRLDRWLLRHRYLFHDSHALAHRVHCARAAVLHNECGLRRDRLQLHAQPFLNEGPRQLESVDNGRHFRTPPPALPQP